MYERRNRPSKLEIALNDLAALRRQVEAAEAPYLARIADIEADMAHVASKEREAARVLEDSIRADVVALAHTVKGAELMAVYAKGHVTWDSKAMAGYAAAHPEIEAFKTVGKPSVSIRAIK